MALDVMCVHLQILLSVLLVKMVSSIMQVHVQNAMQSAELVLLLMLVRVLHAIQTPFYHQILVSLALAHVLLA